MELCQHLLACREALEEAQAASTQDLQQLQQAQARVMQAEQLANEAGSQRAALQQQLADAETRSTQAEQGLSALQEQVGHLCMATVLCGVLCSSWPAHSQKPGSATLGGCGAL